MQCSGPHVLDCRTKAYYIQLYRTTEATEELQQMWTKEKGAAAAHVSGPVAEGLCHGDVAHARGVARLPVVEGLGSLRSPSGGSC